MYGVALIKNLIEALLEDFYMVANIRIAFVSYDMNLWIEVPREKSLFCSLLRKNASFEQKCRLCDKQAFEVSKKSQDLYLYECHAGLVEAVSPIIYEKKLLGYLMMGQVLDKKPDRAMWERMRVMFLQYDINLVHLEDAFYQLKCLDRGILCSAARIMDMSAKYIHFSKLVSLKEPQLLENIKTFIEKNINKPITVHDLSSYLSLSCSHLSHVIKDSFDMSFTQYLISRRIDHAKRFLQESSFKIH